MKKVVIILICLIFMVGCENVENTINYKTISSNEAYKIMNNNDDDVIIIDVRTISEYSLGHIKNAINVPLDTIEESFGEIVNDKNKTILVYCQSGNRSKTASEKLVKLGYTNVNNFGGINNWEYEIVTD